MIFREGLATHAGETLRRHCSVRLMGTLACQSTDLPVGDVARLTWRAYLVNQPWFPTLSGMARTVCIVTAPCANIPSVPRRVLSEHT